MHLPRDVWSNFIIPVCDIELINEIESIKRERESRVYQKKKIEKVF